MAGSSEPLHYATYFDRHYLARGLALYRSLCRHSPPFVLWVLCLDDETYATLERLRLEHVRLVRLAELERANPALAASRSTRRLIEYYWTCTASWLVYLFERQPELPMVTYLDADLFFFDDPTPIYGELGDGAILIVEGRKSRLIYEYMHQFGTYNVGLVAFRRTPAALACLRRWREQCIEWCYIRPDNGRHGDQAYLDDWPVRFEGVVVLRHRGGGLGPWSLGSHCLRLRQGRVLVNGDPLIFYHFSGMRPITEWLYDAGLWRWRTPLTALVRRHIYTPYARELRAATRLIRSAGTPPPPTDSVFRTEQKPELFARMLRHRTFILATGLEPSLPPSSD